MSGRMMSPPGNQQSNLTHERNLLMLDRRCSLGCFVMLLCPPLLFGADVSWPQWRGPDRSDVSTETGLLKEWPASGPQQLWVNKEVGLGLLRIGAGRRSESGLHTGRRSGSNRRAQQDRRRSHLAVARIHGESGLLIRRAGRMERAAAVRPVVSRLAGRPRG